MLVTKHGIVVCADGQSTEISNESIPRVLRTFPQDKALVIKERFVIAHGGIRELGAYSMNLVLKKVATISPKRSMLEIGNLIRDELVREFEGFDGLPKSGQFRQEHLPPPGGDLITTFVIAGYNGKNPNIYEITVKMDWGRLEHVIPPVRAAYPTPGRKNIHGILTGLVAEIQELWSDGTATYKRNRATNPVEVDALTLDQDLDLASMSIAARMMVKIEMEAYPQFVGYPLKVITIPQGGKITTRTYQKQ